MIFLSEKKASFSQGFPWPSLFPLEKKKKAKLCNLTLLGLLSVLPSDSKYKNKIENPEK